jgi:hypothetical protein
VAGTDPRDARDCLRLADLAAHDLAILRFHAVSNRTYTIEHSLAPGADLWDALTNFPARPTNRLETLLDPSSKSQRFYRLKTPAAPAGL